MSWCCQDRAARAELGQGVGGLSSSVCKGHSSSVCQGGACAKTQSEAAAAVADAHTGRLSVRCCCRCLQVGACLGKVTGQVCCFRPGPQLSSVVSCINACGGSTATPLPCGSTGKACCTTHLSCRSLCPACACTPGSMTFSAQACEKTSTKVSCRVPAGRQGGQGGGGCQAAAHRKCSAAEGSTEGGSMLPAVLAVEWPVPSSNLP